jgi:hypothetical protein
MTESEQDALRERIIKEMTADYSDALERNFDLAKQFIHITKDGKVDTLVKENVTGKERILLYLIGKLYAKRAGYTTVDGAGSKELMDELGVPEGSLRPWLMSLKDESKITQVKLGRLVQNRISMNAVERTLRAVEKKLRKTS